MTSKRRALRAATARVHLTFDEALPAPDAVRPVPLMEYYAADSAANLIARIDRNKLGGEGQYRLALTAYTPEDMAAKRVAMRNHHWRAARHPAARVFSMVIHGA